MDELSKPAAALLHCAHFASKHFFRIVVESFANKVHVAVHSGHTKLSVLMVLEATLMILYGVVKVLF